MQFSRRSVYNDKLKPVASEIFISDFSGLNDESIDIFEKFLKVVMGEVDLHLDKFKLIIPEELYPYLEKIDESLYNNLIIKLDVGSRDTDRVKLMQKVNDDGYQLAVEIKDQKVLSYLPENTEFLMVNSDFIYLLEDELPELVKKYICVADNVCDYEQIDDLKTMQVSHFSGDFIEQPEEVNDGEISPNKTTVLNLISKLYNPDVELDEINNIVTSDSVMSFKLLKIINSPLYRGVTEITSIQDAIVRFGFQNLKKWAMMMSLCCFGDKPKALVVMTLQRAIMCSKLAEHLKASPTDPFYTAGLLSMIDAFMDMPIERLLNEIQIAQSIKDAILEGEGMIGKVLDIVKKYQNGDVSFNDPELTKIFMESSEETNIVVKSLGIK